MATVKRNVVKASELPVNYVEQALALNQGEGIRIPVGERRKVLAGLHYYTSRRASHEGWRFYTKGDPKEKGMVFLMRGDNIKKSKKTATKKKAAKRSRSKAAAR